jgi:membrane protein insertase, YidC/Oxa1 family, N-terminal domain
VIVLYSLFFVPEQKSSQQNLIKKEKIEQSGDTPSLEQKETQITISREDALKQSERIQFENSNIIGSISLKGASIDDLTFKNYKVTLDSEQRVNLLGPRNIKEGYLIDSGFVTSDKNIDVPNSDTIWSIEGNNKLTDNSPIRLSWTNDQGLKFEKTISLDDKYLFTIKQKIINESSNKYDFYSYGQIIRNEIPEIIDFLILHEGLIATLDGELIEEDYDDIQEKKFTKVATKGWLGIGDKYWITSLIPPKNKEFKTTFDYKNKFRANFISTEPFGIK